MRVRPQRPTSRRPLTTRRPHVIGSPGQDSDAPAAAQPPPADPHLQAARRHRASVTPEDNALYGCACGFQFEAPVTTSVTCPHCGAGQAW